VSGRGDEVPIAAFGQFSGAKAFYGICHECNVRFGQECDAELAQCGPESYFRRMVRPVSDRNRKAKGWSKSVAGTPTPQFRSQLDGWELDFRPHLDDPRNGHAPEQLVVETRSGEKRAIRLYSSITPETLRVALRECDALDKPSGYLSCDEANWDRYTGVIKDVWPSSIVRDGTTLEVGPNIVPGRVRFTVTNKYFRAIARAAFHYYLLYHCRPLSGAEDQFAAIRAFIRDGGEPEPFFTLRPYEFDSPFGHASDGSLFAPSQGCHVFAAVDCDGPVTVLVHFFADPRGMPLPHFVTLGEVPPHMRRVRLNGHFFFYGSSEQRERRGRVECVELGRS
jgi:hypothetical protein